MSSPAGSAAERVAAADREKRARLRALGRERVRQRARARFDELLTLLGLTLVVEMTGEDKSNLIAMRKGRRPIPDDLEGAVEILAEQDLPPELCAQLGAAEQRAPAGTAAAIGLLQQALEALRLVGARVAGFGPWARRRAPVLAIGVALSCNDPTFKAYEQKAASVARYAEHHPGDLTRLAVQTAMPPPPRRYFCGDDLTYREPESGEVIGCGERRGWLACTAGNCTVTMLGPDEVRVEGEAGWWDLAPGVRYAATWGAP